MESAGQLALWGAFLLIKNSWKICSLVLILNTTPFRDIFYYFPWWKMSPPWWIICVFILPFPSLPFCLWNWFASEGGAYGLCNWPYTGNTFQTCYCRFYSKVTISAIQTVCILCTHGEFVPQSSCVLKSLYFLSNFSIYLLKNFNGEGFSIHLMTKLIGRNRYS